MGEILYIALCRVTLWFHVLFHAVELPIAFREASVNPPASPLPASLMAMLSGTTRALMVVFCDCEIMARCTRGYALKCILCNESDVQCQFGVHRKAVRYYCWCQEI